LYGWWVMDVDSALSPLRQQQSGVRFYVHSEATQLPPPVGLSTTLPEFGTVDFDLDENWQTGASALASAVAGIDVGEWVALVWLFFARGPTALAKLCAARTLMRHPVVPPLFVMRLTARCRNILWAIARTSGSSLLRERIRFRLRQPWCAQSGAAQQWDTHQTRPSRSSQGTASTPIPSSTCTAWPR
jgi:hypothetical protein